MQWTVVGWYSYDATNPHMKPFARVVEVEADGIGDARRKGDAALEALYEKEAISVDFLNWYVKEKGTA